MGSDKLLNAGLSYMACQIKFAKNGGLKGKSVPQPFVTISRQAGAGGLTIGNALIDYLQKNDKLARCAWTLFDRTLVEVFLQEHHLPQQFEKYMTEDKQSQLQAFFEELFDLHPSEWALVHKMSETIYHLAEMGNVLIVGRGANMITRKMPYGVHVRLTGSLAQRIKHIQAYAKMNHDGAEEFVRKEDKGRRAYLRDHFGEDIDNPLLYDLVINTDQINYQETACLIGNLVLRRRECPRA